ncbi:MAG: methylated-DNA--[protein]-cysteine S-methyltransferase, partial [Solirubrobacterales bacterium]
MHANTRNFTSPPAVAGIAIHATPAGPLMIIAEPNNGTVLASGWTNDREELLRQVAPELRPSELVTREDLGPATDALHKYIAGNVRAIDTVPVHQGGSEFFAQAWEQLRQIPPGKPVSYATLAGMSGRPRAVRAAGTACGTNAAALFVPCHRVLRTDG